MNKNQILDEQGIEWIKFFTIPLWCKSLTEQYFAFPPLDELSFENDNVCNALKILVFQDSARSISYELDYVAQNDLLEKINNYVFQLLKIKIRNIISRQVLKFREKKI